MMWPFDRAGGSGRTYSLPLFPLNTVLFPGGLLPLKVFEQRYIDMAKTCMKDNQSFGVCLAHPGRGSGAGRRRGA